MKHSSTVIVKFASGAIAKSIVKTEGTQLTREEARHQHDTAVDNVVGALRELPYAGQAPLRSVDIK